MSVEKMREFIIRFIFYCLLLGLGYVAFQYVMPLLMPFLVGFAFAYLLRPLVRRVTKKNPKAQKAAAVLLLIAFYMVLIALATLLGSRVVLAVRDGVSALPRFYNDTLQPALLAVQATLENAAETLNPDLAALLNDFGDSITGTLSSLVTSLSGAAIGGVTGVAVSVPSLLVRCIMCIIASFFFSADYDRVTAFVARQIPAKWRTVLRKVKTQGVDVLSQFIKAYAILLSITFVEVALGLSLLGVENAIIIALFTALVDILPVLGTGTILIPWGVANLILGHYPLGAGILLLYAIITVVRQVLEPRVVGRQIGLHPLVTLMCMFVGVTLFGILGLFGLPILVTVLVQLDRSGEIKIFK